MVTVALELINHTSLTLTAAARLIKDEAHGLAPASDAPPGATVSAGELRPERPIGGRVRALQLYTFALPRSHEQPAAIAQSSGDGRGSLALYVKVHSGLRHPCAVNVELAGPASRLEANDELFEKLAGEAVEEKTVQLDLAGGLILKLRASCAGGGKMVYELEEA